MAAEVEFEKLFTVYVVGIGIEIALDSPNVKVRRAELLFPVTVTLPPASPILNSVLSKVRYSLDGF